MQRGAARHCIAPDCARRVALYRSAVQNSAKSCRVALRRRDALSPRVAARRGAVTRRTDRRQVASHAQRRDVRREQRRRRESTAPHASQFASITHRHHHHSPGNPFTSSGNHLLPDVGNEEEKINLSATSNKCSRRLFSAVSSNVAPRCPSFLPPAPSPLRWRPSENRSSSTADPHDGRQQL